MGYPIYGKPRLFRVGIVYVYCPASEQFAALDGGNINISLCIFWPMERDYSRPKHTFGGEHTICIYLNTLKWKSWFRYRSDLDNFIRLKQSFFVLLVDPMWNRMIFRFKVQHICERGDNATTYPVSLVLRHEFCDLVVYESFDPVRWTHSLIHSIVLYVTC